MSANPAYDAMTFLAGSVTLPTPASGTVTLTAASNLFDGPTREPDGTVLPQAVFVSNAGGQPGEGVMPSNGKTGVVFRAQVHVFVRSDLDDYATGEALARGCHTKLYNAALSGYLWCRPLSGEVDYLGMDERGCHTFGFFVECCYQA